MGMILLSSGCRSMVSNDDVFEMIKGGWFSLKELPANNQQDWLINMNVNRNSLQIYPTCRYQ